MKVAITKFSKEIDKDNGFLAIMDHTNWMRLSTLLGAFGNAKNAVFN